MILTQGEKLVWAAAFSRAINGGPRVEAADRAGDAVDALRKNGQEKELDALIGENHAQMLRAMLGDEG